MTKNQRRLLRMLLKKGKFYLLQLDGYELYEDYARPQLCEGIKPDFTKGEFELIKENEEFLKKELPCLFTPLLVPKGEEILPFGYREKAIKKLLEEK